MSSTLKGKSIASVVIGVLVLGIVAAMALVAADSDGPVSFLNAAQEEEGGEPAGEGPGDPGSAPTNAPADGEGRPGPGRGRPCRGPGGPLGGAVHGELIVPERPAEGEEPPEPGTVPTEFETILLDNGTVTEVSDTSLTLERIDGETVTVKITDDTKMREDASIEVGDKVHVISDSDGTARVIGTPPERPADAPPGGAESEETNAQGGEQAANGRPHPCRGGPNGPGRPPGENSGSGDVSTES